MWPSLPTWRGRLFQVKCTSGACQQSLGGGAGLAGLHLHSLCVRASAAHLYRLAVLLPGCWRRLATAGTAGCLRGTSCGPIVLRSDPAGHGSQSLMTAAHRHAVTPASRHTDVHTPPTDRRAAIRHRNTPREASAHRPPPAAGRLAPSPAAHCLYARPPAPLCTAATANVTICYL